MCLCLTGQHQVRQAALAAATLAVHTSQLQIPNLQPCGAANGPNTWPLLHLVYTLVISYALACILMVVCWEGSRYIQQHPTLSYPHSIPSSCITQSLQLPHAHTPTTTPTFHVPVYHMLPVQPAHKQIPVDCTLIGYATGMATYTSTPSRSLNLLGFLPFLPPACLQHDVDGTLATVQDILDLPTLNYTLEQIVDQEWVEQIKASYVPVQVAEKLYIVPEWSEPSDPEALNIRLTPGVAFGTGERSATVILYQPLGRGSDRH